MAIVTYIILTALHSGINNKFFRPQILGESASRATLVVLLDFAFVKLGCYFLNINDSSQVVDVFAYGGYKFVGVIVTITAGFLGLKGPLWMLVFVYAFLANAFFLVRLFFYPYRFRLVLTRLCSFVPCAQWYFPTPPSR